MPELNPEYKTLDWQTGVVVSSREQSCSSKPDGESLPPSPRPWFSTEKGWLALVVPRVEMFKYLGVKFKIEGMMMRVNDLWIGVASAVMY